MQRKTSHWLIRTAFLLLSVALVMDTSLTASSGLEQPWQTSWEAFCGELQRLYQRGATKKEMNALFTGKPVTWEGVTNNVDRENRLIWLENKECRVTTADNHPRRVGISFLVSLAKIPDDLKESAKVRFSMTMNHDFSYSVETAGVEIDPESGDITIMEETEPDDGFLLFGEAKLLEYEKVRDPVEKSLEDSERDQEGRGKELNQTTKD